MAEKFETTLRREVDEIAKRLAIHVSRAFAVWYGKVVLRLNEQEALEAASYDGGNDRGTDFFFVDDEWDRVIIAQWKYYASSNKTPKTGDLTQLFNIPDVVDPVVIGAVAPNLTGGLADSVGPRIPAGVSPGERCPLRHHPDA